MTAVAVREVPEPGLPLWDRIMVGLAIVSVSFVFADIFFREPLQKTDLFGYNAFWLVVWIDLGITVLFAFEFFASAAKSGSLVRYARGNWYDVIGMIPMYAFVALEGSAAAGGLRLFRLLRVVRVFVAGSRFVRASDATFGEQVLFRILGKYQRILVDFLTKPILMQGLTMAQENVRQMRFAEAVGRSLDKKRPEIHAAIIETLQKNHVPETVLTQPMVERIIQDLQKQIVDQVVITLTAEKLNLLLQDVVVETLEEFKQQLSDANPPAPSPASSAPLEAR